MQDSSIPTEVEATLAVVAGDPEGIFESIAAWPAIAGHTLSAATVLILHDRYFDTESGALAGARFALRIRETEGARLLALKGKSRRLDGGGITRLELEGPCSAETLAAIHRTLARHGVHLPAPAAPAVDGDVDAALRRMGLDVIQDRQTRRLLRRLHGGGGEAPLGELVLDRVDYRVGGRRLRHWEIEIESRSPALDLAACIHVLREHDPRALRPWDYSKVATGRALQKLCGSAPDPTWFAAPDRLSPAGYEALETILGGTLD